jgi:chromosomal replication initiation ATPase DnaA
VSAQLLLAFEHHAASRGEDFMPAPCNRAALAWLDRWPGWPAPVLTLVGPPGSGKTHLARIFAARAGAVWLSADRLPVAETPAAGVLDDPALPLVDELALLRLHHRLTERRGHLLLTARRPVAAWGLRLPDLASRLRAAPVVAIGRPDDALLGALLVKLFADRQLTVSTEVVGYLVSRMERTFDAARRLVDRLDARSLAHQRPITVALARAALEGMDDPRDVGG